MYSMSRLNLRDHLIFNDCLFFSFVNYELRFTAHAIIFSLPQPFLLCEILRFLAMNCAYEIHEIPRKPYQGRAPNSQDQDSLKEFHARAFKKKILKLLRFSANNNVNNDALPVTDVCLGCICEASSGCDRSLKCGGDVCGLFRITWVR